jgi:uncharacterized protein (TIGR03067 family)
MKATDQELIQGLWEVVSIRTDGDFIEVGPATWEFGASTLRSSRAATPGSSVRFYRLDPAKTPKQLHLFDSSSQTEPSNVLIYDLDGDSLQVCDSRIDGTIVPTEFSARLGDEQRLMLLKRMDK